MLLNWCKIASTASITFLPCIRLCSTAEINFYFYASWTIGHRNFNLSAPSVALYAKMHQNQHCQVSLRFPLHGGNSIQHQCPDTCSTHLRNKQTNNAFQLLRKVSKYKGPMHVAIHIQFHIGALMFRFGNSEVKIGSSRV